MKKHHLIFLPILVSVIFFSCGKTEKEKTIQNENKVEEPKSTLNACSLLDKSEIEKILDIKMKEPRQGKSKVGGKGDISYSECSYESDEGSKIFLSIYIRFSPFKEDALTTLQSVRNSFKQADIPVYDVEGIGDAAFWGRNQLHVFLDDNYYIIITMIGLTDRDNAIDKSKIIAQKVKDNI
jgi:hypothetical protein